MFYIDKKRLLARQETLLLHVLPAVTVFVLLMTLAFISWSTAKAAIDTETVKILGTRNSETATFIQRRMNTYENILRGTKGLMSASENVSREEWKHFLAEYDIQNRYPGVQGIGYAIVLKPNERQHHIETIRAEGFADYTVFPEDNRDIYTAVVYLEPFSGRNLLAHGYDMYTDPIRRKAMDEARDSGKIAISDIVTLVQDKDSNNKQPGFLLYLPIYKKDAPISTLGERRNAISGYVYAAFRVGDLVESAYGNVALSKDEKYGFRLKNNQSESHEIIYESPKFQEISSHRQARTQSINASLPSSSWEVIGSVTPDIINQSLKERPKIILIGGFLFSFFVSSFTFMLLSHRSRILSEKEEKHIQKAKDELLALASHQLRTPATGVKQYVGMLREGFAGKITPFQKQLLDKAYESNERQLSTINEMLFVARADAGFLKLDQTDLELTTMIKDIFEEQKSDIRHKKQTITIDIPRHDVAIEGDPQYIRMALENLVSNATKYTKEGGKITVHLKERKASVLISIVDTGLGVDPKDQHLLFKKFSRIPNELTNKVSGSGIGLYLCKQVAESHNGSITFDSVPTQGSTVTIVLPKKQPRRLTRVIR